MYVTARSIALREVAARLRAIALEYDRMADIAAGVLPNGHDEPMKDAGKVTPPGVS